MRGNENDMTKIVLVSNVHLYYLLCLLLILSSIAFAYKRGNVDRKKIMKTGACQNVQKWYLYCKVMFVNRTQSMMNRNKCERESEREGDARFLAKCI